MSTRIKLLNNDRLFIVQAGQSVLDALRDVHSKEIMAGCCGGGCGICKIRVISGNYSTRKMSKAHISDTDADSGFSLACRTYPQSDMLIEVCREITTER